MSDTNELTETREHNDQPSREMVQSLLEAIAPGSILSAVRPPASSYSNLTHLVEALAGERNAGCC